MSFPIVLYAVPYTPPSPPPDLWPGVTISWAGWDGSRWSMCGAEGIALLAGVRGFSFPPVDRWVKESPTVDGSRYVGHRVLERSVFWPLRVYSDAGSQAWLTRDAAFKRTLRPGKTGVLTVTQPGADGVPAESRSLTLRMDSITDEWDFSPGLVGWHTYGVNLVAEHPFWVGETITRAFAGPAQVDFFDPAGSPDFHISQAGSFATASIPNPGDLDRYPTWWLEGPFTAASVGVGAAAIGVPFTVAAGKMLVIDTSPTARVARLIDAPPLGSDGNELPFEEQRAIVAARYPTGTNRTRDLAATTKFARVPAGDNAALAVSMTGSGTIRALLDPAYYEAW